MLVLSRQKDERIVVGDDLVVITVVKLEGNKVRLGIEAPRELSVNRKEVHDRVKSEEGN